MSATPRPGFVSFFVCYCHMTYTYLTPDWLSPCRSTPGLVLSGLCMAINPADDISSPRLEPALVTNPACVRWNRPLLPGFTSGRPGLNTKPYLGRKPTTIIC